MLIASGVTDVITFQATPEELERTPEKYEAIQKKIAGKKPIAFGVDVVGDMGVKVRFIGEPEYKELGDTLVSCTVHVKVTINKNLAATIGTDTELTRDFTAYAKCSETDKELYDFAFGCRVAMNKAKIQAYSYYQRMFVRHILRIFRQIVGMTGFADKMQNLVMGNAKYIVNICNEKYPALDDQATELAPAEEETPGNVVPLHAENAEK